jgi:hypothetical protein
MYNDVYNYGEYPTLTEQEADPERPVEEYGIHQGDESVSVFKPRLVLQTNFEMSFSDVMLKDVKAGEEIFTNYVWFYKVHDWKLMLSGLRAECMEGASGIVVNVRRSRAHAHLS